MSKETSECNAQDDAKSVNDNDEKKKVSWGKGKPQGKSNYDKKKFQGGGTVGIEEHTFYYSKGMNIKRITSKEKLLSYVGRKYTTSEAASLEKGKMKRLETLERGQCQPNKNLSACCAIAWGQLTLTLCNKIRAKSDYKLIDTEKVASKLFGLVTKVCNRTSTIDHKPTTIAMSLFAITKLDGDKMQLTEYYKHFAQCCKAANLTGLNLASPNKEKFLQKKHLANNYGGNATNKDTWCGRFDDCRRDLNNNCLKGSDHIPKTVDDVYALLQNYETRNKHNNNNNNNKRPGWKLNNTQSGESKGGKPAHSFQQSGPDFP
eukprot:jgi/Psemu1/15203/gm1.15203_g